MASDSRTYINGTHWPIRVPRGSGSDFRSPSDVNIAAIDFGTTSCSVAYCKKGNPDVYMLNLDRKSNRVPTNILIDADGQVTEFGRGARTAYAAYKPREKANHYYFDQIKMKLHHDPLVQWNYTICARNGKEFFLVEVIAMILKHLKERLLDFEARGTSKALKATDFDWVITVPAIWRARGKQMMREAAYKAGLTSDSSTVEIRNLTPVMRQGRNLITSPCRLDDPPNPYLLSLALEPEAAAIHCKDVAKRDGSRCADSKCYMVVDIGGGTVDITLHKVNKDGLIDVILPPAGNDWGGTQVNAQFRNFLGKELLDDPNFDKCLSTTSEEAVKNNAILETVIHEDFEDHKQAFGERNKEKRRQNTVIRLPYSFMKLYGTELEEGVAKLDSSEVELHDANLYLSCKIMEEFFAPAVKKIKKCIRKCFKKAENVNAKIETMFLVGGFGGCKYIHEEIFKEFGSAFEDMEHEGIFRTDKHELAVVLGAVAFRQDPHVVHSRVANATYGSSSCPRFNPKLYKHSMDYRFIDDDRKDRCNYAFTPFVHKGDSLCCDMLLQSTFSPIYHNQKNMRFDIFSSEKCDIMYTQQPNGDPLEDVINIGTLIVNMPIPTGDRDRRVKLTADFTQTEIQLQAYDITSGKKVTTVVDFLTNNDKPVFDKLVDSSDSEEDTSSEDEEHPFSIFEPFT